MGREDVSLVAVRLAVVPGWFRSVLFPYASACALSLLPPRFDVMAPWLPPEANSTEVKEVALPTLLPRTPPEIDLPKVNQVGSPTLLSPTPCYPVAVQPRSPHPPRILHANAAHFKGMPVFLVALATTSVAVPVGSGSLSPAAARLVRGSGSLSPAAARFADYGKTSVATAHDAVVLATQSKARPSRLLQLLLLLRLFSLLLLLLLLRLLLRLPSLLLLLLLLRLLLRLPLPSLPRLLLLLLLRLLLRLPLLLPLLLPLQSGLCSNAVPRRGSGSLPPAAAPTERDSDREGSLAFAILAQVNSLVVRVRVLFATTSAMVATERAHHFVVKVAC